MSIPFNNNTFVQTNCIIFCMMLLPFHLFSQAKKTITKPIIKPDVFKLQSFEILENGDTINRLDTKNIQHGKWVIEHEPRYEEAGTLEVGSFDNGIKVGKWKTYTLQGFLVSDENYKKGLKDGEAWYYEEGNLICVGNYYALNAKQKFDTIMVEDALTHELKPTKIKTDVGSIRHGVWTFYEPQSKKIRRIVEYQADEVIYDKSYDGVSKMDSTYILTKMKSFPHVSNKKEDNLWTDKYKQGGIKYTDIPDDKPVKPNVRKK